MKKILVLSGHTPTIFTYRYDMMKCFADHGYEVVAVGNEEESLWSGQFEKEGFRYIKADIQRNGMNPINDLKTYISLKRIIAAEKPDKIFAYQAKMVAYGGLAAHKYKVDTYSLIAGIGSVFIDTGFKAGLVRKVLTLEYKASLRHSKKVFFQNNDDIDLFVKSKIVKREQVALLHGSGVNLERFGVMPMPEQFGFLYIGRLIRDKGIYEYLEACKRVKAVFPEVRFMLVGPFDTNPTALKQDELKEYTDAGIVEYYGEQKDVRPYIKQCNVFVLPSYREGTPKTVLEAMACERAIITTDTPGCRDCVTDGKNGYLVPVKDVTSLEKKMIELITSPETVKEMALNGRRMAEELYDVKKVNDSICKSMEIN